MDDILNLKQKHWLVQATESTVGKDIELYCAKCKLVRRVKIIAAMDGRPTHIKCYSCNKEGRVVDAPKGKTPKVTKAKVTKRQAIQLQDQNTIDDLRKYDELLKSLKINF